MREKKRIEIEWAGDERLGEDWNERGECYGGVPTYFLSVCPLVSGFFWTKKDKKRQIKTKKDKKRQKIKTV